jgi:putative ABC transport system substrate-binding protein
MRRREFITLLGGAAATWPLAARTQQPGLPVIGYLNPGAPGSRREYIAAFQRGLAEAGYIEGRNVAIEYRWANDQPERLPELYADLVRRQVSVIAANGGSQGALAAKAATTTIPIVFLMAADPVAQGVVASLNRPGGNITGVTSLGGEVGPKRLELLHELLPAATLIALLTTDPGDPAEEMQTAAGALGLRLLILHASTDREIDSAFETLVQRQAHALVVSPNPFFTSKIEKLAALALHHAVPTIYQYREFASAGGLMSYGSDLADAYRLAGTYTGRILKGDKPADLPVQQATKVELIINLKTARALGITVPITLLGRADEVIE